MKLMKEARNRGGKCFFREFLLVYMFLYFFFVVVEVSAKMGYPVMKKLTLVFICF